jgi:hypothetical protein
LDQYAPWIRNVYVVTDKQVPPWLATDHPGLRVVDHTELFADPSTLPTFNSHAIETQLRRIDGLSEHFLYFNDDVFIGRHVEPSLFFYASGVSKFFPSPVKLNFGGNPPPHISAGRVNRALLRRDFDRSITQSVLHTPHPLRRSVLAALEEQYEEEFRATSARRFRNEDDVAVPSSLYPYYAFMTGLAVPGAVRYTYLNLDAADIPHRMSGLLQRRTFDVICMGESGTSTWSAEQQLEMARSFLTEYYPVPSRFERPYPST